MDDERADSYTQTHPVAHQLICRDCGHLLSGDNLPDEVRALFAATHEGHDWGSE